MKQDYDIRFNPSEPSDEQIKSHMDFDALLQQMDVPIKENKEAKRVSLWPKWAGGIAVAATVAGIIFAGPFFQGGNDIEYQTASTQYFNQQPFIQPPFEQAQPRLMSYDVNAGNGGTIKVNNNTNINVLPSTFLDENGQAVNGKVNIKYRNMNDISEYFMSGIPLSLQSDQLGTEQLYEIYAEKDGKRLVIDPEKGLEIIMTERQMNADFKPEAKQVYQLDVQGKKWVLKGQSEYKVNVIRSGKSSSNASSDLSGITQLEQAFEAAKLDLEGKFKASPLPTAPRKFDPQKTVFDLDLDPSLSQQFSAFKNLKWQPIGNENAIKMVTKIEWYEDEIELMKVSDNLFKIKFDNGKQQVELDAIPVLTGSEYQSALNQYNSDKSRIEAENKTKEAEKAAALGKLKTQFETDKNLALSQNDAPSNPTEEIVEQVVEHVFKVKELGIWNFSNAITKPADLKQVVCKNNAGKAYQNTTLYVANLTDGTLSKYYHGKFALIDIKANKEYQMWVVNENQTLSIIFPDEVKQMNWSDRENSIQFNPPSDQINSEADVYKALKLGSPM